MMGKLREWLKAKRTHVLAWSIFITYEILAIGFFAGVFSNFITYAVRYMWVIGFFYLHALVGIPWANKRPRSFLWRLILVILIETFAFIATNFVSDFWLESLHLRKSLNPFGTVVYFSRQVYRAVYILAGATGYYYILTYIKEKKRSADLETERLREIINRRIAEEEAIRSQNAFLVAQINPHFLFNTLDYLYHNLLSLDAKLADAVISLSGMMRFAIDADKMGSTIRLGDELEQVENLIYLHQVRQQQWIELLVDERAVEVSIIPLVLLTFTENVFKHGNLRDSEGMARIEIYIEDEHLHIQTVNAINHIASKTSSLTGLANISKRLEVAYPQKFTFTYGQTETNIFQLHLSINLSALEPAEAFSYHSVYIGK